MFTPHQPAANVAPMANRQCQHQPQSGRWHALEILESALAECSQTSGQIRLALEAVQTSTGADVAFWYGAVSNEANHQVGRAAVSAAWCGAWARDQLALAQGKGEILQTPPSVRIGHGGITPQSIVMVCVSRSRSLWITAVSFDPEKRFTAADLSFLALVRQLLIHHRQCQRVQQDLREALLGLVRGLVCAIHAKNPDTCAHSERVARIAARLGRDMNLPRATIGDLHLAGLLHDIGKIGVRDSILRSPAALTAEELDHVREHPRIGDAILANVAPLTHLRPAVRGHHERFDGLGYPDRLLGEKIPLMARILAVADACDAMMAARPYRPALPTEAIESTFRAGAGTQWDPQVVRHFLQCRREVYTICEKGFGDSMLLAVAGLVRTNQGDAARFSGSEPD
jgi:hypothetical protein